MFREARDFAQGNGAMASLAYNAGSATVTLERHEDFEVSGRLLGWFATRSPPTPQIAAYTMTVEGASQAECPCIFDNAGFGPGVHRFQVSGAGLDTFGQQPILVVADVPPLPEQ